MQFALPLEAHAPPIEIAQPALGVWLAACQTRSLARLETLVATPSGLVVDAFHGRVVGDGAVEVMLVRGVEIGAFGVVARGVEPAGDATFLESLADAIAGSGTAAAPPPTTTATELIAIGFKPGGLFSAPPLGPPTELERALLLLRQARMRRYRSALVSACDRALRFLPTGSSAVLRALLTRERADAIADQDPPAAARNYLESARLFRDAGRFGLSETTQRFGAQIEAGQLELPLFGERRPHIAPATLGYRFEKLFARCVTIPGVPTPRRVTGGSAAERWRVIGRLDLDDAALVRFLAGARGRTLLPTARVEPGPEEGVWRVEACLDSEIAVRLGIAGRTGDKPGSYTTRLFSPTCIVAPRRADLPIGSPSSFFVRPRTPGLHAIEVEFTTRTAHRTRVDVTVRA